MSLKSLWCFTFLLHVNLRWLCLAFL